jgi:hypothetical protein
LPACEAVIVTLPTPTGVSRPPAVIVATAGFEPAKVTVPFVAVAVIVKGAFVINLLLKAGKLMVLSALLIVNVLETEVAAL